MCLTAPAGKHRGGYSKGGGYKKESRLGFPRRMLRASAFSHRWCSSQFLGLMLYAILKANNC
jgi:hypothetical protein